MSRRPAGDLHHHGCVVCSARYSDACLIRAVNSRCPSCRSGGQHGRPRWDQDHDPRPCCRTASVLATKEVLTKYALGGPGPWWRCRQCSRTHPYDPRTTH